MLDCFAALAMTRVGTLIPQTRCHRPAWPGDPVCRDAGDWAERPRRTGFPAFAGN